MLNTVFSGTPGPRPLVIAHGLFGSARNWNVISKRLSDARPVITVDMRNHGNSPWFSEHTYEAMADDLAGVIAEHGGKADVLGHSMGGKAAMVLALAKPDLVGRLIIADIAPKPHDHTQLHLIHALRAIDLSCVQTRRDADNQLKNAISEDGTRAFLLQNLDLSGDNPCWRLNLDVLEVFMPQTVGFPQVSGAFDRPGLFLTGGNSDYVLASDHAAIRALFPAAEFNEIDGVGHWLHAEKPREFEAAVREFLARG